MLMLHHEHSISCLKRLLYSIKNAIKFRLYHGIRICLYEQTVTIIILIEYIYPLICYNSILSLLQKKLF